LKARTREGAELIATMLGENVKAPPERRGLPFDATDAAFAVGAVLAFIATALIWLPAALFVAGVALMVICWRLA
jgi:hypothetical protein